MCIEENNSFLKYFFCESLEIYLEFLGLNCKQNNKYIHVSKIINFTSFSMNCFKNIKKLA